MTRAAIIGVAVVVAVAVAFVAFTLRPANVPTFAPTVAAPRDVGAALVGPILFTVDATDPEAWRHFSFRVGAVTDEPARWDLGFRRYQVVSSDGGGIVDLGAVAFDQVAEAPADGYVPTEARPDPRNAAIAGWYQYGFFSHVLTPKPHVWAVRTSDGRYAKMAMVGYYCPGAQPGCVTFRYVYRGDGSRTLR
jgi:hypothetical protein